MLNKSLAFGLVAAAMLFAPTTALAGKQEQYNQQRTHQNGAAIDHSVNDQNSESRNYQEQTQDNRRYRNGNRDYYRDRDHNRYRNDNRYNDRYHDRGGYNKH